MTISVESFNSTSGEVVLVSSFNDAIQGLKDIRNPAAINMAIQHAEQAGKIVEAIRDDSMRNVRFRDKETGNPVNNPNLPIYRGKDKRGLIIARTVVLSLRKSAVSTMNAELYKA